MSPFAGRWAFAAKLLTTALVLASIAKITSLVTPASHGSLLWPVTGAGLLFAYGWRKPALWGVLLGALIFNGISGDWRWFSQFSWANVGQSTLVETVVLLAICLSSPLQAGLAAWILHRRMPAIRDGSLSMSGWISMLLFAGPVTCLLRTAILAVLLGWATLPLRSANAVFMSSIWVSSSLSVLIAVPLIVIYELRRNIPRLPQNRLRNPWIVLAIVAVPAMVLAAYLGSQQVRREQLRFETIAAALRAEVQAGLDSTEQKLLLMRAFYRATVDVGPIQFDQFAGELLEDSPSLLGIGWAGRITQAGRAKVEEELTSQRGRAISLTQLDDQGNLVEAASRDEYWPLLRIVPDTRKALLGFDLASEPRRRDALLQSQDGSVAASARAVSARADGEHVPAVFLYLATARPRGAVVAPLKIDALLSEGRGRQLLDQGHHLLLSNAGGEVLADLQKTSQPTRAADPSFGQKYALKVGDDSWYLTITTAKTALPYLSAPLWWLGQTLPQLFCVLVGLFLALTASNDRKIFQLERYYAGYVEGLGKAAHTPAPAARFDGAIEQAWNERAFEPWFEPIVDIRSGEIRGAEALLRWPGAPDGLRTEDIIEWAERKNLIGDIDRVILSATLRAIADWPLARLPMFAISVNMSPSEMQNPHWSERVLHELARHRIAGRHLCVEITEGVLIRSDSTILEQLAMLRAAGVRIALDDFGTGYSSIAYLRQLPVDRVKLDRAFVSDLVSDEKARRIVASILALGHTLDVDLVAEAVEDSHTVRVLRELGCQLAQGWYFSGTISAPAMRDLLDSQLSARRARA